MTFHANTIKFILSLGATAAALTGNRASTIFHTLKLDWAVRLVAARCRDQRCAGQSRGGELPTIAVATDDDFMRSMMKLDAAGAEAGL